MGSKADQPVAAERLFRDFVWMTFHGQWHWGRNRSGEFFSLGRTWYDGPIWFAFVGPLAVSISV